MLPGLPSMRSLCSDPTQLRHTITFLLEDEEMAENVAGATYDMIVAISSRILLRDEFSRDHQENRVRDMD